MIGTVMLIAITIAAVAAAWAIISPFVNDSLQKAGDCSKIFEQITLEGRYTCYDQDTSTMLVSISRKDFDLTSLLVSVSGVDSATTFTLTEEIQNLPEVTNYPSSSPGVELPGKEGGKTYCVSGITQTPEQIKIAPKVGNTQCEIISATNTIIPCAPDITCS